MKSFREHIIESNSDMDLKAIYAKIIDGSSSHPRGWPLPTKDNPNGWPALPAYHKLYDKIDKLAKDIGSELYRGKKYNITRVKEYQAANQEWLDRWKKAFPKVFTERQLISIHSNDKKFKTGWDIAEYLTDTAWKKLHKGKPKWDRPKGFKGFSGFSRTAEAKAWRKKEGIKTGWDKT